MSFTVLIFDMSRDIKKEKAEWNIWEKVNPDSENDQVHEQVRIVIQMDLIKEFDSK